MHLALRLWLPGQRSEHLRAAVPKKRRLSLRASVLALGLPPFCRRRLCAAGSPQEERPHSAADPRCRSCCARPSVGRGIGADTPDDRHALLVKCLREPGVAPAVGPCCRAEAPAISRLSGSARAEQQIRHALMAAHGCKDQSRPPVCIGLVHVCAPAEQELHCTEVPVVGSMAERRHARSVRDILHEGAGVALQATDRLCQHDDAPGFRLSRLANEVDVVLAV
mmetsp:Transcript_125227/g.365745  ORF Transcript_125227/g.365745 Transcript_125227/m.365745 type:complete len:223 (-) Transcript_125227:1400-2068(-)